MADVATELNQDDIKALLPHRYPMLLIDSITKIVPHESATGFRNLTEAEPYFEGHFPGQPVMPGVLQVESMGQTAAALVAHSFGGFDDKLVYFMTIDRARFRQPVIPPAPLEFPVWKIRSRGPVYKFGGEARVGDSVCAEAEFSAMIVDKGA